jgi:hypothetical protein
VTSLHIASLLQYVVILRSLVFWEQNVVMFQCNVARASFHTSVQNVSDCVLILTLGNAFEMLQRKDNSVDAQALA